MLAVIAMNFLGGLLCCVNATGRRNNSLCADQVQDAFCMPLLQGLGFMSQGTELMRDEFNPYVALSRDSTFLGEHLGLNSMNWGHQHESSWGGRLLAGSRCEGAVNGPISWTFSEVHWRQCCW